MRISACNAARDRTSSTIAHQINLAEITHWMTDYQPIRRDC